METLAVGKSVVAQKFDQLDKLPAVSRWDALTVYVADVKNSPEEYLKTIDYITTTKQTVGLAFLLNTETLLTMSKEAYWPKYRLFKDHVKSGVLAQVHHLVWADELSGKSSAKLKNPVLRLFASNSSIQTSIPPKI